jgi:hypothetical protein
MNKIAKKVLFFKSKDRSYLGGHTVPVVGAWGNVPPLVARYSLNSMQCTCKVTVNGTRLSV